MLKNDIAALAPMPDDPILGLVSLYQADERPNKVNLGVGVYLNEAGKVPLLEVVEEAERRGLANLANTAQALPKYILPKNIELMTRQGVYSKEEILSRHEIHMEKYCKVIRIEARTLVDMVQHEILDAVSAYEDRLCGTVLRKRQAAPEITCHVEKSLASTLAIRNEELLEEVVALKTALETEPADAAMEERVTYYHEVVEAGMEKVCETVNQLEALTATRDWPYPTFYKLLFSV